MSTNNAWNTPQIVNIANGGTGTGSFTAYTPICGGTTSTGALQSVASLGNSGDVLASQGSSALPQFVNPKTIGAGLVLVTTKTASASATIDFTSGITSSIPNYLVIISNVVPDTSGVGMRMVWSTDGGSTYLSTGYLSGNNSNTNTATTLTNTNASTFCTLTTTMTTSVTFSAIIFLYNMNTANNPSYTAMTIKAQSGAFRMSRGAGYNTTTSGVNAIRFQTSSGNITSGSFSLYQIIV